ncbi:MAG: hypothetical protein HDT22_08420 [Ruminococcus sp.]|nr:hypothetical protein [Ruminococcus sp.]
MKNKKKMKNRLIAGIMSAAMLTSMGASTVTSVPVAAADNDYYEALALSLYFFDGNACGTDVDDNPLTWRGNCHTYDEKAAISEAENFDSSYKSLVDPDGDGYVDVSGGYHDAGDHIKFNLTMGFAMSSLAMSEYLNPGVYEKAGAKDHLVALLKRNADYLMKTTFLDDSGNVATICHVVADGGVDHSEWKSPEDQTYPRKTYWLTKNANNSAVCGEMACALAGTAYVVKDSDPAYASTCLKYAKALYEFGSNYKGNEGGGLSSYYGTNPMCSDELALAQTWLWINGEASKPTATPNNGNYNGDYDYYLYSWDKVWQGYAAMMYKATGDSVFKSELEFEYNNNKGLVEGTYNADGWGASRYNCAKQMVAYALANGDANSSYAKGAKWQMDYILGNNSSNKSFLVGYGSAWPTKIHHRAANPGTGNPQDNTDAKYTLYGALIGGPNANGEYEDNQNSYSCTEPALDYNGCFALACAALADLYGGSDKSAASILSNASEVKYPFSFGTPNPTDPTPTDPTPTDPTPTDPTPTDPTPTDPTPTDPAPTDPTPTDPTPTDPTPTDPTPTNPPVSGEKDASYTEKKNEDDKTYWTFDITGGEKLTVTMKTNSSDTETNGCFNYSPSGWNAEDWTATPNGNGEFTVTYTIPSGQTSIDFYVWWPESPSLVSAVLTTSTQPTPTDPTPTDPTPTDPTPTDPTPTEPDGNRKLGDANLDGVVDIIDIISINKAILGQKTLEPQGLKNVDFNNNGMAEPEESLTIMRYIVELITESEMLN